MIMTVCQYRRCRQQTYVVVCAAVTVLLLFAHYFTLDKSDSGRGKGTILDDGSSSSSFSSSGARAYGMYDERNSVVESGGIEATGTAGGGGYRLDRFVEGGQPLSAEEMAQQNAEWKVDQALKVSIDEGSVQSRRTDRGVGGGADGRKEVPYLHCGPMHGLGFGATSGAGAILRGAVGRGRPPRELLLLHGARYSKEDWRTSGVLDSLCLMGRGADDRTSLSVTAIDLPAEADGADLVEVVGALGGAGIMSGGPVFVVTPSASGRTVVDLGEMAAVRTVPESAADGGEEIGAANEAGRRRRLKRGRKKTTTGRKEKSLPTNDAVALIRSTVRGWISVASPAVLGASPEALRAFPDLGLPILAVYGSNDDGGKMWSTRLVEEAGALRVELEGGHACFLDSPDAFVRALLGFIDHSCADHEAVR